MRACVSAKIGNATASLPDPPQTTMYAGRTLHFYLVSISERKKMRRIERHGGKITGRQTHTFRNGEGGE